MIRLEPTQRDSLPLEYINRDSGALYQEVRRVDNGRGRLLVVLETPGGAARVTLDAANFDLGLMTKDGAWSSAAIETNPAIE